MMARKRKPQQLVKAKSRAQYEALHRLNTFLDSNTPKLDLLEIKLRPIHSTACGKEIGT